MSNSDEIKQRILDEGLRQWPNVSCRAIGRKLEMSHTNILYHFGGMDGLKDAIATEAVRVGNSMVIAQLILERHPAVKSLDAMTKAFHLQSASA